MYWHITLEHQYLQIVQQPSTVGQRSSGRITSVYNMSVLRAQLQATVNVLDSRAVFRMDMGFYSASML